MDKTVSARDKKNTGPQGKKTVDKFCKYNKIRRV